MSDFYGNRPAMRILQGVCARRSVGHAYLMHGDKGLGKQTFAMLFAMSLFCKEEHKPCGVCSACKKMLHQTHPDFTRIDPTGKSNSIAVETVRKLRMDCAIKPNESDYKVYLLCDIDRMTPGALNAFLKTLEEPPSHVVFLLTTRATDLLAPTILSRVTPVPLFPLDEQTVRQALAQDFGATDEQVREQITLFCDGNLGMAKQLLTQGDLAEHQQKAIAFCEAIATKQEYQLLRQLTQFERDKPALSQLITDVSALCRQALRCQVSVEQTPVCPKLAERLTQTQLMAVITCLAGIAERLKGNGNYNLSLFSIAAGIGQCID